MVDMNSAQEELLALLLEEQGIASEQAPPLTPRARNTPPPLSFAQQRLWFLEQWEQGSAAYNIFDAARLSGVLKVDALERALSEIVRRHEVLRTTFKGIEGTPVQVIHPAVPLNLPLIDLRLLPRPQREAEVLRMAGEAACQPFNLDQGPLLRVTLLRVDEHEHVLLLTIHHIIFDVWSRKVFRRELHTLYEAYLHGRAAPLPELPIQYADYVYWQREWLESGLQTQQMAYWKERLGGALPVLELPADYPRPARQTFNGALLSRVLPDALGQALLRLGQREGATLFMTLLAVFKALLQRYTGQHDIIVGTPIANRARIETEGLIGFFLNTLALRTDLSGDPSFTELLTRVREQALQAYDHQDLPFERLVEELQPTRDPSHSPLFQVMFVLQNDAQQPVGLPGVTSTPLEVDNHTAKFDLTVFVIESGQRLTTFFEYNTDLFSEHTVARWLDHWQTLLEGIVADPAQRLSDLPLLSAPERHQLLVEWNPWPPSPAEQTLAGLFEAQVERTPHAVAVVFEDQALSYDELNGRANQLAHRLRALGVGPEVLVGLCMERSIEMVVGLLGILKAGGAYVPLDPGFPKERLAFLLEDTGVRVLIAQQRLVAQLPAHRARVLCLPSAALEEEPRANPVSGVRPDHLAYVMYTSGSTGTPKGVAVPQRAVARLVTHTDYVTLGPEQVFLQLAPLAFDASTFELWGALLNGGKLVVFPPHTPTLAELGATLQARRITTLWLTAGLFHAMVDEQLGAFRGVRQLLAGGDVLSVPHVQRFLAAHPDCRLINGYGPTENTTFSCCYTIPPHAAPGRAVPIGRPIANTQAYILDAYCHPVPIGVSGELYLGGAGLARGYHNRPELTAEKFIPHPFSPDPDARLYKTGDLACYLADGNIEFLGRTDHQVKIRGFRIELGEIEAVLGTHPSIKEAVVIAREDTPGDKRLVAYLAASPAPSSQELRNYLMARLPEYMLPAIFVMLDALPLTPNGKLDRKALPAPGATQAGSGYTAPRDNLELQLSKIWERLLRVPAVGIHDNFFELGGHSLLAVRLVAQIEKIWGKNVPLATLFQAPAIDRLADILRQQGWSASWSSLVPIQPLGTKPPFFWVHGGGGNLLQFRKFAEHLGADQPFYGLQAYCLDGRRAKLTRVEDMAAHYITELRTVQAEGPYYLGGHCFGGWVALEMAQQLSAQGEQVAFLACTDSSPPPLSQEELQLDAEQDWRDKMKLHRDNLTQLSRTAKLMYFIKRTRTKLRATYERLAYKFYLRIGIPIPQALRIRYIFDVNVRAQCNYIARPYAGSIILLWADHDIKRRFHAHYQEGWRRLAAGVENYDLPLGHTDVFRDPYVRHVAERLTQCLARAQAAHGG